MVSSSCSTTMRVFPRSRSFFQSLDQPGVVPLVKADGGLIQDVENAGQVGADLSGQADALRLAAGEGAGVAG